MSERIFSDDGYWIRRGVGARRVHRSGGCWIAHRARLGLGVMSGSLAKLVAMLVANEVGSSDPAAPGRQSYGWHPICCRHGCTEMLDLTAPGTARLLNYSEGRITDDTRALGAEALREGYNAIRYRLERIEGGLNLVVLRDFDAVLRPIEVRSITTTPTPP